MERSVIIEWLTVGVFLLCFVVAIVVEAVWLTRKNWTTAGKSAAFVLISDFISLCVGFVVPFIVVGTMIALAWSGDISKIAGGDTMLVVALIFAAIFPFVFLFFTKRIFLAIFQICSGKQAWIYSLAASVASLVISFLPPIIFFYIALKLF